MNELISLGIILLLALLAGHLVKFIRVPEVTGYILAGVLVGPSVLGWITHDNLQTLEVFSEVALGLILFSIGAVFEFTAFAPIARRVVLITAVESALTAVFVSTGILVAGQPWPVALLLGAIAIETAAATTLMVMRECNSSGPLTETLTGIIAINNVVCLAAFSIVTGALRLMENLQSASPAGAFYHALFPLVWQLIGGMALGYLVGLLLTSWSAKVVEQGETLILLVGCILLCVGASSILRVSPLIASLTVGATMVNLSSHSRRLFRSLSHTDPPLYAIFFVIAGADLNLQLLASLGVLGVIYVVGRTAGKLLGARIAGRRVGLSGAPRELLGYSMLSQAGLAIGLTLALNRQFPDLAPTVTTVVLSAIAVFEIVGPLGARFALDRAGETRSQSALVEETALL